MSPQRQDVFDAISLERDYQDGLTADRTDGHTHSVGEGVLLLQYYVHLATSAWCDNAGDLHALNQIRKIAAICVRCMEDHGIVER